MSIASDKYSHKLTLNDKELKKILLHPAVCGKKVAVISVAGALRKGKSFLLNFFLRYLRSKDKAAESWLGEDKEELKGFSWRGGSNPDTTGILLWEEPFFVQMTNGETVVVLLMDTQGTVFL